MSSQSLNLPIHIPWKQIAVSQDMMDEKFCNKLFPFSWRSSMAISIYEPKTEELPEDLCGDLITYIKVTTSITGYQPTKDETELVNQLVEFPNFPAEKEDLREAIDRITKEYFACYGSLLNVAVFPYPSKRKELIERLRIDFSKILQPGALNSTTFLNTGSTLDNPYTNQGVIFEAANQNNNRLVDLFTLGNGTDAELDLFHEMTILIPANVGLAAIEAKVTYLGNTGIKINAFSANGLVGTAVSESEPNQVHTLVIEADDIQKVVITSPDNETSLLEFAYFIAREVTLKLKDFPHIIDFEPKKRDLYQGATESGEILTSSNSGVHTDKTFTHTNSSESGVAFGAKFGPPNVGGGFGGVQGSVEPKEEFSGSYTKKWGETDQDQSTIQTDASRERRETQGTTSQISQMYNLLTGYHAGTNRAVFLMLGRPHSLQPTDFRTFAQGLRSIEGQQDYFLIVARPEGVEGLCIEASLETGHFPEDAQIIEPEEEYEEDYLDFIINARAKGAGLFSGKKCDDIQEVRHLPVGWVADLRPKRRNPGGAPGLGWDNGYPGVAYLEKDITPIPGGGSYQVSDGSLLVTGKLCGEGHSAGPFGSGSAREFQGTFRVFIRRERPVTSYEESHADIGRLLVTSRKLCTCFKSGKCPEIVSVPTPPEKPPHPIEHIVDEPRLMMNKALLTRGASNQSRLPAMKEFMQKVQSALTTSSRNPARHAFGEVGFLESDYFKDQIKDLLPDEYLRKPLDKVKGLPAKVLKMLGDDLTIGEVLEFPLAQLCRRTGLSIKDASKFRYQLLSISLPESGDSTDPTSKNSK